MSKRIVEFELTDEGELMIEGMCKATGRSREEVVKDAMAFFVEVVKEAAAGRVIGVQSIHTEFTTFHDWNVGGYFERPVPHKVLLTPDVLAKAA